MHARTRTGGRAPRAAVVGAGLAGLACARALQDGGLAVTVFDKGRGPGGRASTRRTDIAAFDHGAQFFTAREPRFVAEVGAWRREGVVARWDGRFVTLCRGAVGPDPRPAERFVGVPSMSAVARHLATGLAVRPGVRVGRIGRVAGEAPARWQLADAAGTDLGAFEVVVVATPAPQAAALLAAAPDMAAQAAAAVMAPCIAVMAVIPGLDAPFDAAFVDDSPLAWIARDGRKPQRDRDDTWVLHASHGWSAEHVDDDPALLAPELLGALADAIPRDLPAPAWIGAHRWRHALPVEPLDARSVFDAALGIGVCGDWCGGARVEAAFVSGLDAAARVLRALA